MTKLSKAQQKVMDDAKAKIDFARTHTLREWAQKKTRNTEEKIAWRVERCANYGCTAEEMRQGLEKEISDYMKNYSKCYENEKNAIVYTSEVNSRTLEKLESFGMIEIIYDSKGQTFGIDTIKVVNY